MFVFIAIVLLSTTSVADTCCSPDQWQSDVGLVITTYTNGKATFIKGTMKMTFDEVNKIAAYDQSMLVDGKPVDQRIVNDHKNGVMYIIGDHGCTRAHAAAWFDACIPANATESSQFTYGLGQNSIQAKGYIVKFNDFESELSVTMDTCIPVIQILVGKLSAISGIDDGSSTEVMEALNFVNFKSGIDNRNVFYVPAQCVSASTQGLKSYQQLGSYGDPPAIIGGGKLRGPPKQCFRQGRAHV